ncbi:hypothetical protein [Gulosibacter faecalis]|uniref:Uncharacterized protein n=1 Tax=Gulosibacter faecalis TaxID=272240 RepID=A0ABW5UWY7_9MICO|nr:hypothetical protein [Gulosibacter faecalis]
MGNGTRDQAWQDELIRLGGSIHQDHEPRLSEDEAAAQQAGIERYYELLDAFRSGEHLDEQAVTAILWSLHPIQDYGIYEAAYGVLSVADGRTLGVATARVLPAWLRARGTHSSIEAAAGMAASDDDASEAFLAVAREWTGPDLDLVRATVDEWVLDDEDWVPIAEALGKVGS